MLSFVDRYWGFTLNILKASWVYRFRIAIWIVYDFVLLAVQYYLWSAIFSSNGGQLFGVSAAQYLSYVGMALVVGRLVMCDNDGEIAQQIKQGDIAQFLVKPVNYFTMMGFQQVGKTLATLFAMVPLTVVVVGFIGLPALSWPVALAGGLAVVQAYILVTTFAFLLGTVAFWITNYWGLFLFKQHIIALFSGEVIALSFLHRFGTEGVPQLPIPGLDAGFLQGFFLTLWAVSYGLPFQAMSYTPSAILTGLITGPDIVWHLALQTLWIGVLGGLTAWVWSRAQHRITILGG